MVGIQILGGKASLPIGSRFPCCEDMRKILCVHLEKEKINQAILEECSRHSQLVEPRGEKEVLLDLSIFKQVGEIVKQLADFLQRENAGSGRLGLGINPLTACCAASRSSLPTRGAGKKGYRYLSLQGMLVVQVIPGQEAEFIGSLPLDEFPCLAEKERQKLMRLGYSRVGEIAGLSPQRLGQLLKREAQLLWFNCQGIDYSPVRGAYPADRLAASLPLPGCENRYGLEKALEQISIELGNKMERRYMACRHLCLEILGEREIISRERLLGYACYEASHLTRVLSELLLEIGIPLPVEELRVYLDRLERVEVATPDLFTWHQHYQEEERRRRLQEAVQNLLQRFPRVMQMGPEVERREQVLALWDPWRYAPEDGVRNEDE